MYISTVKLKGFRNFKDATINLSDTSLIIGSNDIGKSNLLHALRILLDKSLSDAEIEPKDSDFYAFEATDELSITIHFTEAKEECVRAKLGHYINDDKHLFLRYSATRQEDSGLKDWELFAGSAEDKLEAISSRFYLKVLNLKFIGSKRDLSAFIRRERKLLIQDARLDRTEEEIDQDNTTLQTVEESLNTVTENVNLLNYVQKATTDLNHQLLQLSHHHGDQDIIFDTGQSDPSEFVEGLKLSSRVNGRNLTVGGDGRNNQIQLALWAARNNLRPVQERMEFNIFCIEEPETHLHPHQQRKLAQYLNDVLSAQVIITTHSPQIACQVSPSSIVRLYNNQPDTKAAGNGSNPLIKDAWMEFGYRLNIIATETFFSNIVLLVEGPSEVIFYKALAKAIDIDLDRLNISILMADGIGFKHYVNLLSSLNIEYVIRTDNDVFKEKGRDTYRFAGLQRALSIFQDEHKHLDDKYDTIKTGQEHLKNVENPKELTNAQKRVMRRLRKFLESKSIFLSEIDLEHDLYTHLEEPLQEYFDMTEKKEILKRMQKRKATYLFEFLQEHSDKLDILKETSLAKPLIRCKTIVENKI